MANAKKLNVGFPNNDISIDFGEIYQDLIEQMAFKFGAKTTQQMIHNEVMDKVQDVLIKCPHGKELFATFDDWIPEIHDRHVLRDYFPNQNYKGGQHGK